MSTPDGDVWTTPEAHAYTSTACQHGIHARCRLTCKFCRVGCGCPCHPVPEPPATQHRGPLSNAEKATREETP